MGGKVLSTPLDTFSDRICILSICVYTNPRQFYIGFQYRQDIVQVSFVKFYYIITYIVSHVVSSIATIEKKMILQSLVQNGMGVWQVKYFLEFGNYISIFFSWIKVIKDF